MQSVHQTVRDAEQNFVNGTTTLGKYVNWSMHETVERIFAYLNSKHMSGDKDSLGRDKPFFNIVTAAVNIWYRATDIDRKDIRFIPSNSGSVVTAFVGNVMLQNWMQKERFGQFLNEWGRVLAQYGSAVVKFVDKGDKLHCSVTPWNRFIPDPVSFDALPRVEKLYKTPAQLQNMASVGHPDYVGYDMDVVKALVDAVSTRKTIDGQAQDVMSNFIEIYEVHGVLDTRLLLDDPKDDGKDAIYSQQMHVVSFVGSQRDGYDDFTLYKGPEKQDSYMLTHLIEEDGRTMSIGAVEHLFDSQWMQNHSMKIWKDNVDLASKLIFQTADSHFVGRNVLTAIETGDILVHQANSPITKVPNDEYDITNIQSFQSQWKVLAQEVSSTPDAVRGNILPSGTPYSLAAYTGNQALSLFEIMTENKGLAIEDMMRTYIIPHLKKKLKHKDEIVAILDAEGVQEIDTIYIPNEAIRRHNKQASEDVLNGNIPAPFDPQQAQQAVQQDLNKMGNKRFFKPDELDEKQWNDIFSDFAWDNIRVEVTNEQSDKQAVLATLSTVFQTLATNPAVLQDPNARMVFSQILSETGRLSPLQLTAPTAPAAQPQPAGQQGQALSDLSKAA